MSQFDIDNTESIASTFGSKNVMEGAVCPYPECGLITKFSPAKGLPEGCYHCRRSFSDEHGYAANIIELKD